MACGRPGCRSDSVACPACVAVKKRPAGQALPEHAPAYRPGLPTPRKRMRLTQDESSCAVTEKGYKTHAALTKKPAATRCVELGFLPRTTDRHCYNSSAAEPSGNGGRKSILPSAHCQAAPVIGSAGNLASCMYMCMCVYIYIHIYIYIYIYMHMSAGPVATLEARCYNRLASHGGRCCRCPPPRGGTRSMQGHRTEAALRAEAGVEAIGVQVKRRQCVRLPRPPRPVPDGQAGEADARGMTRGRERGGEEAAHT